jgi:hypothetical protein
MTFVKSAPKKSFSQKTILLIEKNWFFGQNFFRVHELKSPKWKQPLNISENGFL